MYKYIFIYLRAYSDIFLDLLHHGSGEKWTFGINSVLIQWLILESIFQSKDFGLSSVFAEVMWQ